MSARRRNRARPSSSLETMQEGGSHDHARCGGRMVRHPADSVLRTAAAAAPLLWETPGRWTTRHTLRDTGGLTSLLNENTSCGVFGRCTGDMIPSMRERQTYATTTILDAWGREWAGCPGCDLYDTRLLRVSRPGRGPLGPGGRVFAQRPLSGAAPGRNAPAHVVDHRAPSA